MTKDLPHHHGDLREALIAAGLRLLAEGGPSALTLRRAAALAGVSHAAPAHHFDGLKGLQTAMAARAYAQFTGSMIQHRAAAELALNNDFSRLVGVCDGYLAFAMDRAGLFHLLFVSAEVTRDDPQVMQASAAAYQVLRDACLPFSPDGTPDPQIETLVWTMVHGYALLGLNLPDCPKRSLFDIPPFDVLLARILQRG